MMSLSADIVAVGNNGYGAVLVNFRRFSSLWFIYCRGNICAMFDSFSSMFFLSKLLLLFRLRNE